VFFLPFFPFFPPSRADGKDVQLRLPYFDMYGLRYKVGEEDGVCEAKED